VKDTNLQKYKPIGCCPNCDGIFLIRKRGQRSCSSTCYQKEWIAAKMKVDPRYFANKARDNRLARKKLATKKAKQKK
jgi:hypothetical protein